MKKLLFFLLFLFSISFSLVYFVPPTPDNEEYVSYYPVFIRMQSDEAISNGSYILVDGNIEIPCNILDGYKCEAKIPYNVFNYAQEHTFQGFANISGTYKTTKLRTIYYYSCSTLTNSVTLMSDILAKLDSGGNCFELNGDGIELDGAGHSIFLEDCASGSKAIYSNSDNLLIYNLNIFDYSSDSIFGIYLSGSDHSSITQNYFYFENNGDVYSPLFLMFSNGNFIIANTFDGTGDSLSLRLFYSSNNTIAGNTFSDKLVIGGIQSADNKIYNNIINFYSVADGAEFRNYWNTTKDCVSGPNIIGGPCIGGNYWKNYGGVDVNGDGIGDNPNNFTINNFNIDYLPLTNETPSVIFVSPTAENNSIQVSKLIINITTTQNVSLSDNSKIEIDGTNYTCTLSSDTKSCYYEIPYNLLIYNKTYTIRGYANISGVYFSTNETRTFNYYGCGNIISNTTLIDNLNASNFTCCLSYNGIYNINGNNKNIMGGENGICVYPYEASSPPIIYLNITNISFINNSNGIYTHTGVSSNTYFNIINSYFINNSNGIYFDVGLPLSMHFNISNSTFINNYNGIYIYTDPPAYFFLSEIKNNNFIATDYPFYVRISYPSSNNVFSITNNYIENANKAFYFYTDVLPAFNLNLTNNFVNNSNTFVYCVQPIGTYTFYGDNYIINNRLYNVTYNFNGACGSSGRMFIFNNYFTGDNYIPTSQQNIFFNTTKDCTAGPNIIGGPCIGGNYWSIAGCVDEDFDGICDNPDNYTINTYNIDYLPLTQINRTMIKINNIYNITQNVLRNNLTLNSTLLYVSGTLELNFSGVNDNVKNYNFYIAPDHWYNDSTANSSWKPILINLTANSLNNISSFEFFIPVSAESSGDQGPHQQFAYPYNLQYTFKKNYTRNINNINVVLTYPTQATSNVLLYACNKSVCDINTITDWSESLEYFLEDNQIIRFGDSFDDLVYILSFDINLPSGGSSTSLPPQKEETVQSTTKEFTVEMQEEGSIAETISKLTNYELKTLPYKCEPWFSKHIGCFGSKYLDILLCEYKGILSLYAPRLFLFPIIATTILVLLISYLAFEQRHSGFYYFMLLFTFLTIIQSIDFFIYSILKIIVGLKTGVYNV